MVLALDALNDQLEYYLLVCLSMIVLAVLCFVIAYSPKTDKDPSPYGFALSIMLIVYLIFSVVPFAKDAVQKNIVVETGVYSNQRIEGKPSRSLGIYYVTLDTGDEMLSLSTPPGRKNIFTRGTHEVLAYYLPNAKLLLHIEMIE